jgi:signal peptidase I
MLVLAFRLVGSYLPTWIQQEIDLFEIPSNSMLPTLEVGDRIFVNKSNDYSPHRGDVMVFREPEGAIVLEPETDKKKQRFFVKRVIGEPGKSFVLPMASFISTTSPYRKATLQNHQPTNGVQNRCLLSLILLLVTIATTALTPMFGGFCQNVILLVELTKFIGHQQESSRS